MYNGFIGFLEKTALIIGLGGSADTVDIAQAKQLANQNIDQISSYHNFDGQTKTKLVNIVSKNIEDKGFLDEIETLDLDQEVKKEEHKSVFGKESKENNLPKSLKLHNIYYFNSCYQPDGWSCGFFTVYNACALNKVLITSPNNFGDKLFYQDIINISSKMYKDDYQNINSKLSKNYKLKGNVSKYLSFQEIYDLADLNNLNNFYVLAINGNEGVAFFNDQNDPQAFNFDANAFWVNLKNDLDNAINTNSKLNLYFACNVSFSQDNDPDHWVLISVIRLKDKNPVIILFDSINKYIANKSYCDYIKFLHAKFIAPYMQI